MEDFFQLNSLLSTIYKFQSSHSLVHPIAGRSPIKVLSGILWLHHKKKTQSGFTGASAWSDSQQALKEACVYEVDENVPWVSIWLNGLFCNKILRPNRKSLYFVILSPFFFIPLKNIQSPLSQVTWCQVGGWINILQCLCQDPGCFKIWPSSIPASAVYRCFKEKGYEREVPVANDWKTRLFG